MIMNYRKTKVRQELTLARDRFPNMEAAAPFPEMAEIDLEGLKQRMLREALEGAIATALHLLLRRAANEAAAVAWMHGQPLLVFPVLFAEKAAAARKQYHKQELIRSRSAEMVGALA